LINFAKFIDPKKQKQKQKQKNRGRLASVCAWPAQPELTRD